MYRTGIVIYRCSIEKSVGNRWETQIYIYIYISRHGKGHIYIYNIIKEYAGSIKELYDNICDKSNTFCIYTYIYIYSHEKWKEMYRTCVEENWDETRNLKKHKGHVQHHEGVALETYSI